MFGAPWPVPELSRPADELDGALAGAHGLKSHLGQFGKRTAWGHVPPRVGGRYERGTPFGLTIPPNRPRK